MKIILLTILIVLTVQLSFSKIVKTGSNLISKAESAIKKFIPVDQKKQNELNKNLFICDPAKNKATEDLIRYTAAAMAWVYADTYYDSYNFEDQKSTGFSPEFDLVDDVEVGDGKVLFIRNNPKKYLIVAARGTRKTSFDDWATNANLIPYNLENSKLRDRRISLKGYAHEGFVKKSLEIQDDRQYRDILTMHAQNGFNIVFTGHSQGGALAGLLALYFRRLNPGVNTQVFTYGAAKYLSEVAITEYSKIIKNYCRLENENDPVVKLGQFGGPGILLQLKTKYPQDPIKSHTSYPENLSNLCADQCDKENHGFIYVSKLDNTICPQSCKSQEALKK